MGIGKLIGIGVGPGDPELLTVKGVNALKNCKHLFVPKAKMKSDSLALDIAKEYVGESTKIYELIFPMVTDKEALREKWIDSAGQIAKVLKSGDDAVFLTLGDSLLYSTYIYLVRALLEVLPETVVETIPGITAFSNVASLTNFPVGEAKEPVMIIPAADDLTAVENAINGSGTVILMKIGKRLNSILDILEKESVIDKGVFVAYAGQKNERIETDLRKLRSSDETTGYLSTIIVKAKGNGA